MKRLKVYNKKIIYVDIAFKKRIKNYKKRLFFINVYQIIFEDVV